MIGKASVDGGVFVAARLATGSARNPDLNYRLERLLEHVKQLNVLASAMASRASTQGAISICLHT